MRTTLQVRTTFLLTTFAMLLGVAVVLPAVLPAALAAVDGHHRAPRADTVTAASTCTKPTRSVTVRQVLTYDACRFHRLQAALGSRSSTCARPTRTRLTLARLADYQACRFDELDALAGASTPTGTYSCTAPLGDSCGAYRDTTFSFNSNGYNSYVSNQDLGLLGSQTLYANGPRDWKVVSDTPDDGGRVQTFPNAQQLFNDYTTADGTYPLSAFSSLTVHYDETSPGGSANHYQFSPDIFFGNYPNDVMFWTDVNGRCNEGAYGPSLLGHLTMPDGSGWTAHRYDDSSTTTGNTGAEIILVKDGPGGEGTCARESSGTIDVKAGLGWLASEGFLPAVPSVYIVQTGWEITAASKASFVVHDLTYQAALN